MSKETKRNKIYRKIWSDHNGPIPKDAHGRSYEIHHINGNHNDNRLENLMLVTWWEHYKIHRAQGDLAACNQLMMISRKSKAFRQLTKSLLMKRQWQCEEYRKKTLRCGTPEEMLEYSRLRWSREGASERHSENMKKYYDTPEGEALKKRRNAITGKKNSERTPEQKAIAAAKRLQTMKERYNWNIK